MTLEVVQEICSVTLWCCNNAKALCARYNSLCVECPPFLDTGTSRLLLSSHSFFSTALMFFLGLLIAVPTPSNKLTSASFLLVYRARTQAWVSWTILAFNNCIKFCLKARQVGAEEVKEEGVEDVYLLVRLIIEQ